MFDVILILTAVLLAIAIYSAVSTVLRLRGIKKQMKNHHNSTLSREAQDLTRL